MLRTFLLFVVALGAVRAQSVAITFNITKSFKPLDGRLLLLLSTNADKEPRFQIGADASTQQVFGLDVVGWIPGQATIINSEAYGYPARSLSQMKPGEYIVQGVLDRYETFHLASGPTIKLPMDHGEGRHWNLAPGNLYSTPQKVHIDRDAHITIDLDHEIEPIKAPADTKYVKHVWIQSKLLTKFWGRNMFIGAHVLLPEGFDTHPYAQYPLMVFHGHYPSDLSGFRTEPPDDSLKPDYSERFRISGYNRIEQQEAYAFYKKWIGPDIPRMLIIEIEHANPYYDDSYAVNSANIGPYGDAIMHELVPYIEKKFRGIGEGWARFTYGGSTGGWEALAAQIFYPTEFNGSFAACPDPIDFRAYTVVDLYKEANEYYVEGPQNRVLRPGMRDYLGHLTSSLEQLNLFELALGTKGRSGQQWDIWQAVYSPQGADGYPKPIFDKLTGQIDHEVANYWREHYDLHHILERDWAKLGPKVQGKIHIYAGTMDNIYLNDAVYLMDDFLKGAKNPPADAEVKYGDRFEHCWNGDPTLPNHLSRLHYNTMYIPKILEQIQKTAPKGADLKSWRY